ncbi:hypothetical protein V6N13_088429 [Hibiscus sabdariffa]
MMVQEGSPVVQPLATVFDDSIADWKLALVAQFIGSAPNFSAMKKITEILWGKSSTVKVSLAGQNLYVFSFSSVADRDWVLENGPWHIQNKPLVIRKWEPNMQNLDFELSKMPIWFQLYNVPLELFNQKGLSYISSALGTPLYMDFVTSNLKRLEFAKVCIEVDAAFPFCSKCHTYGHFEKACVVEAPVTKVWNKKEIPEVVQGFTTFPHVLLTLVDSIGFPSLQDSIKNTGRDRSDTGQDIVGSANKFVVLSDGDVTVPEGRKPRAASQGVTNILN